MRDPTTFHKGDLSRLSFWLNFGRVEEQREPSNGQTIMDGNKKFITQDRRSVARLSYFVNRTGRGVGLATKYGTDRMMSVPYIRYPHDRSRSCAPNQAIAERYGRRMTERNNIHHDPSASLPEIMFHWLGDCDINATTKRCGRPQS